MAKATMALTDEEKVELRNKAKEELNRLDAILMDRDTKKKVDDFKDRFTECEIVYKVILDAHQFKKTGKHPERMLVTMTQVPYALDFAGYDFDKELLTNLFSGRDKVGQRSVKKLRDSLTHSLNQKAIDELKQREEELYGYMNDFLTKIREFDA